MKKNVISVIILILVISVFAVVSAFAEESDYVEDILPIEEEFEDRIVMQENGDYMRYLVNGMSGDDVIEVQRMLSNLGYDVGAIDGEYGSYTETAVRAFQKEYGLYEDGEAGSITIEELNRVTANIQNNTESPSVETPNRYLKKGMNGQDVIDLQNVLAKLGYTVGAIDGVFGSYTEKAVLAFQADHGLFQDGEVGEITVSVLRSEEDKTSSAVNTIASDSDRILMNGMRGTDVEWLQTCLTGLGYPVGTIDGVFGIMTENAVKAFQMDSQLLQDGIVDEETRKMLANSNNEGNKAFDLNSFSASRILSKGTQGTDVLALQTFLAGLGYSVGALDGDFGKLTEEAVLAFQSDYNLFQDGVVGNQTVNKIKSLNNQQHNDPDVYDTYTGLKNGMSGNKVSELQKRLSELGYSVGNIDGIFGNVTENAIIEFQKKNLINSTGEVDNQTNILLVGNPINAYGYSFSVSLNTNDGPVRIIRNLSYESEGDDVKALQNRLLDLGYLSSVPKGYFGNMTYDAVVAFQKDHGMQNPNGIADEWTYEQLNVSNVSDTKTVPEYSFSSLVDNSALTDKNYDREGFDIRFIIPHHMAGKMTGIGCANYFVNNGLENSANYCVGYNGDIAVGVPEDFGAWTSSWWAADEQGITIEVSDEANGTDIIADNAVKSLIYLCADLIRRNPSLGTSMVYDPGDEQIVKAAKKANNPSGLNAVKGNILLHNWTSGGTTTCPGQDMKDKLPIIATKVNELLANPNAVLDLSEITKITQDKHKQQEEEQKEKEEQEEEQEEENR